MHRLVWQPLAEQVHETLTTRQHVISRSAQMASYRSIIGLVAIADNFDVFYIDQFGVLHDGVRPYSGAIECLAKLKKLDKQVVLLSNSGKRAAANIARLAELGFVRDLFDHVVTSGEVAWKGISEGEFGQPFVGGKKMFLVGHEGYDYGYERIGIGPAAEAASSDFVMIAASRAPKLTLEQYGELLASAAAAGVPALCCNPDRLMLTTEGLQPSAGEIAALYERLGGKVVFVGKPYGAMYSFAKRQIHGSEALRSIAMGDSMEHDIAGGRKAGLATALVLTGLSSGLTDRDVRERVAFHDAVPDFVMPGLAWTG